MSYIDTSVMYHLIKSQSVIKLYIFYNMLEVSYKYCTEPLVSTRKNNVILHLQVGDRLFSAFGQDIIDALFWTATEPKNSKASAISIVFHLISAVIYVCILFYFW